MDIDKTIAERIFGDPEPRQPEEEDFPDEPSWEAAAWERLPHETAGWRLEPDKYGYPEYRPKRFSSDIRDAMTLVDHLRTRASRDEGWDRILVIRPEPSPSPSRMLTYSVVIEDPFGTKLGQAIDASLPMVIARAALKAIGIET